MIMDLGEYDAAIFLGLDIRNQEGAARLEERRQDPCCLRNGGEVVI